MARKTAVGTFRVNCQITNHVDRDQSVEVSKLLVDTGSGCTWIAREILDEIGVTPEKTTAFILANGQEVSRRVGFAIIRIADYVTVDEVVFAELGDLLLLGARTLEGLNVTVDSARKRLVPGGPHPAALAIR